MFLLFFVVSCVIACHVGKSMFLTISRLLFVIIWAISRHVRFGEFDDCALLGKKCISQNSSGYSLS